MRYSIRDIEKLTQIKAHTLRIWEQRYGFLVPYRTDTNIRYYDDEQLKLLLNIASILKNGSKISHVARMSPDDIAVEVRRLTESTGELDVFCELKVDALLMSMIDLDELHFEKVIADCNMRMGFEQTMVRVIIPFLKKVGILWSVGDINVAQEHFISNLIRRKLLVAIDMLPLVRDPQQDRYLLYLPDGELHEIGLLFAKYVIKSRKKNTIYLGQSVPFQDLRLMVEKYEPHYLITYFTSGMSLNVLQNYLNRLGDTPMAERRVLVAGPLMGNPRLVFPPNVRYLRDITDLIQLVSSGGVL